MSNLSLDWVSRTNIFCSMVMAPKDIPCSLVLNGLISNAYKHAFRDREEGRTEVSLKSSGEDTLLIKVKDDGIGIPQEIDIDKVNSLGLKVTRAIIQGQLQGNLEVKRDRHTEIIMEFKLLP
jgi:two-component sensor histidine kinase